MMRNMVRKGAIVLGCLSSFVGAEAVNALANASVKVKGRVEAAFSLRRENANVDIDLFDKNTALFQVYANMSKVKIHISRSLYLVNQKGQKIEYKIQADNYYGSMGSNEYGNVAAKGVIEGHFYLDHTLESDGYIPFHIKFEPLKKKNEVPAGYYEGTVTVTASAG